MEGHSVPGTFIHHFTAPPGVECYDPHLANEAPKAQRSSSTCLRSPREQVADPGGLSDLSVFCPVCTDTHSFLTGPLLPHPCPCVSFF